MTPEIEHKSIDPQSLRALYSQPLPSNRLGPLYNAFSYPTKISPEAIALYIATHTLPGATIMDTFAGSGTTGLAAKLCDCPTEKMTRLAHELGLSPVWGPRKAVLYELSVIGSFIAEVMCNPPDPALFEIEAATLVREAYAVLGALLEVVDDQGLRGTLRHAIWSEVLVCPHCSKEQTFWQAAVKQDPLRLRALDETYQCSSCGRNIVLRVAPRATEQIFDDVLGQYLIRRKRVLVRVYGTTGKRKWQRSTEPSDQIILDRVEAFSMPGSVPKVELKLGDLYRSGYHFGLTHLHHIYTRRNLISIATLLDLIEERSEAVRPALRLLVLSYNQSHATLMTRVVVKDGLSDFVLTGAQSGVLYVSSLPVEKNLVEGIQRKVKSFSASFSLVRGSRSTVVIRNQSSTSLSEADESVDYLFTDPPFADFIPYSEINQINELWLGMRTDDTQEAVISRSQGKTLDDYGTLMSGVFVEAGRVLKKDGIATVVFHAAKASVWSALQQAYQKAGFEVAATSVLDKLQASFKQVVATISVKGDPLLLLTKRPAIARERAKTSKRMIAELIEQARQDPSGQECEPSRLYSRYVNRCLANGDRVQMNASDFYAIVQGELAK